MTEQCKTPWQTRLALARLGIHTDSRLSTTGIRNESGFERAYGLWAKSWYWQGWISEVSFHDHAIIDLRDRADCHRQIERCHHRVLEVVERGLREFPDSIPCLSHQKRDDGMLGLVESSWAMQNLEGRERDNYPTELLPEGLEEAELPPRPRQEGYIEAQLVNADLGLHVEDQLNTYTGRARYARDCKDRNWHYVQRVAVRKSADHSVKFQPTEFTSLLLTESEVTEFSKTTGAMMANLFASYAPGGSRHGLTEYNLPPGFATLDEYRAEQESRRCADDPSP